MNLLFRISIILLFVSTQVNAQEALYIYKDGVVIKEFSLSEIDSVIFYKPAQGSIIDVNGNEYKTAVIGTQTWMAENLRTTLYNDNTPISNVTDNAIWSNITIGAYCWYNNDISNKETYGALYNWYTIETDKLCPSGWHVPSKTEWTILADYLDGWSNAGSKLKSTIANEWAAPNTDATNSSGFNALPAAARSGSNGSWGFGNGTGTFWWSSDFTNTSNSWYRYILSSGNYLGEYSDGNKKNGYSVRCVKN